MAEIILDTDSSARAHDKRCNGCKNHKRDIMLSFGGGAKQQEITDVFLTTEQASFLMKELGDKLEGDQNGRINALIRKDEG